MKLIKSCVIRLKTNWLPYLSFTKKAQKRFSLNLVLSQFYIPVTDFPPFLLVFFQYFSMRQLNLKNKLLSFNQIKQLVQVRSNNTTIQLFKKAQWILLVLQISCFKTAWYKKLFAPLLIPKSTEPFWRR